MSVYVTRDIWKFSQSEHGARLVLLALGDSGHRDLGTSMLKQETIARMTRLSVSSVREAIRLLEEMVEVETRQAVKGRARINIYRVLLGEYTLVEVDESELACRLLEPFSTPAEVAEMKAARAAGIPIHDRQELAVVNEATTASSCGDDRQNPASHKEEPVLDPGSTREAKNASLVAPSGAESERIAEQLRWALTGELGIVSKLTRSEHGAWATAIADLVEVGATVEELVARCAAYRVRWPEMALTPLALVRHWNLLGAAVEIGSTANPVEKWIDQTATMFDPETAHELLDDRPGLDDRERTRLHKLLDERFAAAGEQAVA